MAQIGINTQMVSLQVTQVTVARSTSAKPSDDFVNLFDSVRNTNASAQNDASGSRRTDGSEAVDGRKDQAQTDPTQPYSRSGRQKVSEEAGIKTEQKRGCNSMKTEETDASSNEDQTTEDSMTISIICTIMVQFAQTLEVTLGELEGSFEQLNLDPRDILNGSGIGQLVLSMNGANDMSELLMNADLSDQVSELTGIVNEILDEFAMNRELFIDILDREDIKDLMADVNEKLSEMAGDLIGLTDGPAGASGSDNTMNDVISSRAKNGRSADETQNSESQAGISENREMRLTETTLAKASEKNEDSSDNGLMDRGLGDKNGTLERNSKPDQGVDTMYDRFIAGMEKAVKSGLNEVRTAEAVSMREIVYQLVDAIKVSLTPDKSSLELQLTPESLGKVQLSVSSKEGVMTAKITTENETARAAVESQLETLKETINSQGYKVESIEVTVSGFTFADSRNAESGQNSENGSERKKNVTSGSVFETETLTTGSEGVREQAIMDQSGSTVSYVA